MLTLDSLHSVPGIEVEFGTGPVNIEGVMEDALRRDSW